MKMSRWRTGRWPVAGAIVAALLSHGAAADLVGHLQWRLATAGKSDQALIESNPALERLAREHPDALEEVLVLLRTPVSQSALYRTFVEDGQQGHDDHGGMLARNPDLAQYYRESPEAFLDLLRLIRQAAQQQ
jgi:hypothetical protein